MDMSIPMYICMTSLIIFENLRLSFGALGSMKVKSWVNDLNFWAYSHFV